MARGGVTQWHKGGWLKEAQTWPRLLEGPKGSEGILQLWMWMVCVLTYQIGRLHLGSFGDLSSMNDDLTFTTTIVTNTFGHL